MNMIKSLSSLVAAAAIGLSLPAAATDSDFIREMARTDGDFQGASAATAREGSREPAKPMTREDFAFLGDLARPDGLGIAEPVETPSAAAVAAR